MPKRNMEDWKETLIANNIEFAQRIGRQLDVHAGHGSALDQSVIAAERINIGNAFVRINDMIRTYVPSTQEDLL